MKSIYEKYLTTSLKLANKHDSDPEHFQKVTVLSCLLFDKLKSVHKLGKLERIYLMCAALLHDIGYSIDIEDHHKGSLKLILESPLLIFSEEQRQIVGSIARYHRKSFPKESHWHYKELSKEDQLIVLKLASILRIADGLDATHSSIIEKIKCRKKGDTVFIRLFSIKNADAECLKAIKKSDMFEQTFDLKIDVAWKLLRRYKDTDSPENMN